MHIPDGFISMPLSAATYVASGGLTAAALRQAGCEMGEKQVPFLGVTAAFVFAAQMLNFPVAGGTSGHFLGAILAAVLLGPLNAFLVLAVVLTIQCLGFADGGLTALGANIFNMGFIGGIVSYGVFSGLRAILPKTRGAFLAAIGVASWLSVVLAASACALELAASGTVPLTMALPAMAGVHALIGIGEALITVTVVSMVLQVRPDLVASWHQSSDAPAQRTSWAWVLAGGVALSLVLAIFASPFASAFPDGLEKVAETMGFMDKAAETGTWKNSPLPDYAVPGLSNEKTATALAGLLGTIVVLLAGWGLVRLVRARGGSHKREPRGEAAP